MLLYGASAGAFPGLCTAKPPLHPVETAMRWDWPDRLYRKRLIAQAAGALAPERLILL